MNPGLVAPHDGSPRSFAEGAFSDHYVSPVLQSSDVAARLAEASGKRCRFTIAPVVAEQSHRSRVVKDDDASR